MVTVARAREERTSKKRKSPSRTRPRPSRPRSSRGGYSVPPSQLSSVLPRVVGDAPISSVPPRQRPRKTQKYAKQRRQQPTHAEERLQQILNSLNGNVLRGSFKREWAFENWILDFYFPEIRLGIEVDGLYHQEPEQQDKDRKKASACERHDITLLRLSNGEVFGSHKVLVDKLRDGWRAAKRGLRGEV